MWRLVQNYLQFFLFKNAQNWLLPLFATFLNGKEGFNFAKLTGQGKDYSCGVAAIAAPDILQP